MFKNCFVFLLVILSLVVLPQVLAIEKPSPPIRPTAPEVPAPPDISGVYDVPERPAMKVRVFAHPAKPTPPPRPGTPKPSSSPSGSPSPSSYPSASPIATPQTSLVCGLNDPDSNSVVKATGWKIPAGNWSYLLNPASVPSTVGKNNLEVIVKAGFDQYKASSGNKINFAKGANTTISRARLDNKNIIAWGNASNGTLGVTYVWYYPSTGLAVEIDTIMNNRYKWSWSNSLTCADNNTYDAQDIMTHELGHWMGLGDEYDFAGFGNNTMYGYGSLGEVKKNTLTTGDILGIQAIYP